MTDSNDPSIRASFEAWCKANAWDMSRVPPGEWTAGDYAHSHIQGMWKAWLACSAMSERQIQALAAYEEWFESIFCSGRPLQQDGKPVSHTLLNKAHNLAASVLTTRDVRQQEPHPVGYQRFSPNGGWVGVEKDDIDYYRRKGQEIRPIYARPVDTAKPGRRMFKTRTPVTLVECPIGLFICGETLALKTEYGNNEGRIDAYIVESGEMFWGDQPQTIESQRATLVWPVTVEAGDA